MVDIMQATSYTTVVANYVYDINVNRIRLPTYFKVPKGKQLKLLRHGNICRLKNHRKYEMMFGSQ